MKCKDLILHDFVEMLTTQDYSLLSSDPESGKALFEELYDEYNALMNTNGHAYILSILNEIASLKARYISAQATIMVLQQDYDKNMVELLQQLGYQFDPDKYLQSINMIDRKLKTVRLNIDRKLKEYGEAIEKMKSTVSTYQGFVKILAVLSNSVGFHLNIRTVTVSDFAAYYDLHLSKIKSNAGNRKD